jgi:hypothetical protein
MIAAVKRVWLSKETKFLLVLTLMAVSLWGVMVDMAFGAESSSTNFISAGTQFVDLMVKEDFAGAVGEFDSTMKGAVSEQKLREIWHDLQDQAGPYKKRLRTRVQILANYELVFVTCQFERTDLDVKVVFSADKQVAGLFFVPSQLEADSFAPPPYAKPSAYQEKDFTVGSGEWSLPGTLTLPVSLGHPLAAVVLVHGSGPEDRDETIMADKPFRDLAWGLATKGIAVLRYEKRTKEHADKFGGTEARQFTVKEETIDDALSAVAQLRKTVGIDPKRIFVLGHSLGGMVAPRIGHADPDIAGLIVLAAPTRPLEDLIAEQTRYLMTLNGTPSAEEKEKLDELLSEVAKIKKLTPEDASSSKMILGAPPKYWLDMREHDPLTAAETLSQPLLILQGGRDYQVTETDFSAWKKGLGSKANVTFKWYPELNHLFMAGTGKSTPAEFEQPNHVAENVITDIADWIRNINPTSPSNHVVWDAMMKKQEAKAGDTSARLFFNVTNISASDAVIERVETSCGCTVAQIPSQPWILKPQQDGKLDVVVDLRGKSGTLTKTITVYFSGGSSELLTIKVVLPDTPEALRLRNQQLAAFDRQLVFKDSDCARCHADPTTGKMGLELYAAACGICHDSKQRATMVPDLTALHHPTDKNYWKSMITDGKPTSLMPGFGRQHAGPLSPEQIDSLVVYLWETIPHDSHRPPL